MSKTQTSEQEFSIEEMAEGLEEIMDQKGIEASSDLSQILDEDEAIYNEVKGFLRNKIKYEKMKKRKQMEKEKEAILKAVQEANEDLSAKLPADFEKAVSGDSDHEVIDMSDPREVVIPELEEATPEQIIEALGGPQEVVQMYTDYNPFEVADQKFDNCGDIMEEFEEVTKFGVKNIPPQDAVALVRWVLIESVKHCQEELKEDEEVWCRRKNKIQTCIDMTDFLLEEYFGVGRRYRSEHYSERLKVVEWVHSHFGDEYVWGIDN